MSVWSGSECPAWVLNPVLLVKDMGGKPSLPLQLGADQLSLSGPNLNSNALGILSFFFNTTRYSLCYNSNSFRFFPRIPLPTNRSWKLCRILFPSHTVRSSSSLYPLLVHSLYVRNAFAAFYWFPAKAFSLRTVFSPIFAPCSQAESISHPKSVSRPKTCCHRCKCLKSIQTDSEGGKQIDQIVICREDAAWLSDVWSLVDDQKVRGGKNNRGDAYCI